MISKYKVKKTMLTSSSPEIPVRAMWFSPDWFVTGGEKTQRASVSHTATCQLRAWLTRAPSEGTVLVFVEDKGQVEGRKDAEHLTQPLCFELQWHTA